MSQSTGQVLEHLQPRRKSRAVLLLENAKRFAQSSVLGACAAIFLVVVALIAIFASFLAPLDPNAQNYSALLLTPNMDFPMGTDSLGRDTLSRVILGTQLSLIVSVSAVTLSKFIGFTWGILSGYVGGRFDLLSQRVLDVLISFPSVILALLLLVALGAGVNTVIIAIAATGYSRHDTYYQVGCAADPGVGVCACGADDRRISGANNDSARHAAVHRAAARGGECEPWRGDLHGGGFELSRTWSSSSGPQLGEHAGRHTGGVFQAAVVVGGVPWVRNHADHSRVQPVWRRAARPPRSETAGSAGVVSRVGALPECTELQVVCRDAILRVPSAKWVFVDPIFLIVIYYTSFQGDP